MQAGLRSIGYQYVSVACPRCGHEGDVAPERLEAGRFLRCRICGFSERSGIRFDRRLIYADGTPPDNVMQFRRT